VLSAICCQPKERKKGIPAKRPKKRYFVTFGFVYYTTTSQKSPPSKKNKISFPASSLVLDTGEQKVGKFNTAVINYTWINNIYTAELPLHKAKWRQCLQYTAW
jgi:hypothetical protein